MRSYKPPGALLSPQVKVAEQHKRPGQDRNGQGLSRTVYDERLEEAGCYRHSGRGQADLGTSHLHILNGTALNETLNC
jgi:hypothetical protein